MIEHELLEMLDSKNEPCNDSPKYAKDNCARNEIEKFTRNEYGCTPPFMGNKEKICTNATISKQVLEYWDSEKFETNCLDPCTVLLIRAMWMQNKIKTSSSIVLSFQDNIKVVKSYYAYSGLSLIAEIGGYIGLFLGVSINQIPHLTSFVQERVHNYF